MSRRVVLSIALVLICLYTLCIARSILFEDTSDDINQSWEDHEDDTLFLDDEEGDTDIDDEDTRHFLEKPLDRSPSGWTQLPPDAVRIDRSLTIPLLIFVRQQDPTVLVEKLHEVSNPMHHSYGEYLTNDEVNMMILPTDHSMSRVQHFLSKYNITQDDYDTTLYMHIIKIRKLTIGQIERMFQCKFQAFRNDIQRDWVVLRTLKYSVPYYLREAVDFISPSQHFDIPWSQTHREASHGNHVNRDDTSHFYHPMDMNTHHSQCHAPLWDKDLANPWNVDLDPSLEDNRYTKQRVAVVGHSQHNISPADIIRNDTSDCLHDHDDGNDENSSLQRRENHLIISKNNRPTAPNLETTVLVQYLTAFPRNVTTITHLPSYMVATDQEGRTVTYLEVGEALPSFLFDAGTQQSVVTHDPHQKPMRSPHDDPHNPHNSVAAGDETLLPNIVIVMALSDETMLDAHYLQRIRLEVQKLSLTGVTVLSVMGEGASAGKPSDINTCAITRYFPSTIPEVVSIGHIAFTLHEEDRPSRDHDGRNEDEYDDTDNSYDEEDENHLPHGFRADARTPTANSKIFLTPSYQKRALKHYATHAKNKVPWHLINLDYRIAPDVSFSGENCVAMFNKKLERLHYSPVCALTVMGIFAIRANQEMIEKWGVTTPEIYEDNEMIHRVFAGRPLPTVGAANHLLYTVMTPIMENNSHHYHHDDNENNGNSIGRGVAAMIDVQQGATQSCNSTLIHAEKGFDLVSGWGILIYTRFLQYLNAMTLTLG